MRKVTLWKGTKRHEKARKGTSERKSGATYWVNMQQIMRDVLRGALMENLIIDKWVTCRKCEKLPFEKARKGTKRHERAQVGRHILSEYAPNHVAIWLLQPDCRLKTCWKFTSSYLLGKKAVFLIWQFPGMPPSQEGVGHAWRFHWISLNFIEFHWISLHLYQNSTGSFSAVSTNFWIFSSSSLRGCF